MELKEENLKAPDEFTVEQLDNVVGGVPYEVAVAKALENPDLFRDKSIEDLRKLKEDILRGSDELTLEELDDVKAGIIR